MDKTLLKQIGAAGIYVLFAWTIFLLGSLGTLQINLGLLFALGTTIVGGAIIGYFIISFFTGAKISDIRAVKELLEQLMNVIEGNKESDSTEENTT